MPKNPPADMSRITPYILYEDVAAALDWLTDAFGFGERMRIPGPDGTVSHAEMELADDGVIMMGNPGPEYQNPKRTGQVHQLIYVYVDDVDGHFKQAKAAGATITAEPEDQFYGDRRYAAKDLEGHEWNFATRVRDIPPEEMRPPS
jgi:uncharacterized glyoxalase superfamily protein PhnB